MKDFDYVCEWIFHHKVGSEFDYPPFHYTTLFSKEFWFIEKLVKNGKLDLDWGSKYSYESIKWFDWKLETGYENVIMILSIQDEPIQFLDSILKKEWNTQD